LLDHPSRQPFQKSLLFKLADMLVRLDHVALTDLTHFRIFPRNLAPDFTHYFNEQPENEAKQKDN